MHINAYYINNQAFRATGRDANGGYAEYMTVHENLRRTIEIYYRLAVVKAAALLDRMMDGETVGAEAIVLFRFYCFLSVSLFNVFLRR